MNTNIKRIIFAILIVINCIAIFALSSQDAEKSSETSGVIVNKVVDTVTTVNKKVERKKIENTVQFYVRKTAHFTIYTFLGIFLMCEANTFNANKYKKIATCMSLGALYAFSDEFHQSFIGGRSPELRDVCIDSCGVMVGCLLALLVFEIVVEVKNNKKNN